MMIKIYRENYEHLPKRFINKIESDLDYLAAVRGEISEMEVI